MKKLIVKLFLFAAPLTIVFFYVEFRLKKIPNSYTTKKKYIEKHSNQIKTVVLGSSQALYSINPAYFTNTTINFANASQSLYFDVALLEKYINKLPNLKTVIIPISYFSFYYDMNDGKEKMRTYAYYHFFDIKNHNFSYFDAKNYSLVAFLGVNRVMTVAKCHFKQLDEESISTMTEQGFLPMDSINLNKRISDSLGKKWFNYHQTLIKEINLKRNISVLDNLLQELAKKNIKVYFISTPTYKTYYQNFDSTVVIKNNLQIQSFCKKYKSKYLNWSTDTSFVKEDFYDNDHLNKYGAIKFSKLLDSTIHTN